MKYLTLALCALMICFSLANAELSVEKVSNAIDALPELGRDAMPARYRVSELKTMKDINGTSFQVKHRTRMRTKDELIEEKKELESKLADINKAIKDIETTYER